MRTRYIISSRMYGSMVSKKRGVGVTYRSRLIAKIEKARQRKMERRRQKTRNDKSGYLSTTYVGLAGVERQASVREGRQATREESDEVNDDERTRERESDG